MDLLGVYDGSLSIRKVGVLVWALPADSLTRAVAASEAKAKSPSQMDPSRVRAFFGKVGR